MSACMLQVYMLRMCVCECVCARAVLCLGILYFVFPLYCTYHTFQQKT